MSLITNIGRSGKIVYGTQAVFSFVIRFPTLAYSNPSGLNPAWDTVNQYYKNDGQDSELSPTAGTITIAGVDITLVASDIISPAAVALAIANTVFTDWDVSVGSAFHKNNEVTMVSTTVGALGTAPTIELGDATNIIFETKWSDGVDISQNTDMDDILILGRTPIELTLDYTEGEAPDVCTSTGTSDEQANGTLTYSSPLTFTDGVCTITTPVNYIRVSTKDNTQVILYITR